MKRVLSFLVLTLLLGIATALAENSTPGKSDAFTELRKSFDTPKEFDKNMEKLKDLEDVTGLEWFQMSIGEKQDHILASMFSLNARGVTLKKSPNDYFNLVEEKLHANPNLYDVSVTEILAGILKDREVALAAPSLHNKSIN